MYHLTLLWLSIVLLTYTIGWFAGNASAKRQWFGSVRELHKRNKAFDDSLQQHLITTNETSKPNSIN